MLLRRCVLCGRQKIPRGLAVPIKGGEGEVLRFHGAQSKAGREAVSSVLVLIFGLGGVLALLNAVLISLKLVLSGSLLCWMVLFWDGKRGFVFEAAWGVVLC